MQKVKNIFEIVIEKINNTINRFKNQKLSENQDIKYIF